MAKVTMTPVLGAAGGSMANLTFVRQPDGTTSMRERKGGADPNSPAQSARRRAMARMVEAWQTLADAERDAWEGYAMLLHDLGPTPSLGRSRAGYRVFSQLTLKALQVSPEGPVAVMPPSAPFYGDGAKVTVASLPLGRGRGGVESVAPERDTSANGTTPTLPSPKGEAVSVTFFCLVPNSPGVVTELLVQPLASPGRKGEADKYRTRGFVAFAQAGQTVEVPSPPGVALCAVRFVEAATGQASGLVPLGRLTLVAG